jgi:uncharacterized protein YcbK (DUF882 family)
MAFGVSIALRSAIIGLLFASSAARAEQDERYNNPDAKPPAVEEAAPEPAPAPVAKPRRSHRRDRGASATKASQPSQPSQSSQSKADPIAAIIEEDSHGAKTMPALTVRTYSNHGDALSSALRARNLQTGGKPMKTVYAAPISVEDRPAPAFPTSRKVQVESVSHEDHSVRAPSAPSTPDAVTTRDEADYLVKQVSTVITRCFPPKLRGVLASMSRHFGSPVIVTSGFRSRGRRGSYHRVCMAADVQIAGVRPSQIIAYAQRLDDVGGLGTYSYTRSIHVDVREQKISWRGNRGRGWFRVAQDISRAAASGPVSTNFAGGVGGGGFGGGAGGGHGGGHGGGGGNAR